MRDIKRDLERLREIKIYEEISRYIKSQEISRYIKIYLRDIKRYSEISIKRERE